LQEKLGVFPLLKFWGPGADISSSRWIAEASVDVLMAHRPSLLLVYLPHLDYNLQRLGPNDPRIAVDVCLVDAEAGKLIDAAREQGAEVVVVSEYAITQATTPVHINRVLRESGYLTARLEPLGWETLDPGASRAFAVADHQIAHVYIRDAKDVPQVSALLAKTAGIERVLDEKGKQEFGLDHPRSGELVAVAAPGAWFTYYFWLEDKLAPDFARTVDIHRKPGYDPVELLVDPQLRFPKLRIARRLAQKLLGFRYSMDVISLDASLIRGTHGRLPTPGRETSESPVFIASSKKVECDDIPMTAVKQIILDLQF
jgi:predicted AlkP superfamily pyrophosphatase or phosphodiesterase